MHSRCPIAASLTPAHITCWYRSGLLVSQLSCFSQYSPITPQPNDCLLSNELCQVNLKVMPETIRKGIHSLKMENCLIESTHERQWLIQNISLARFGVSSRLSGTLLSNYNISPMGSRI